jgi:hypothetical protein
VTAYGPAKVAGFWLSIVAATTLLNSVLLQVFSRFLGLPTGLSLTLVNDAIFVGLRSAGPGSGFVILLALIVDASVVCLFLILARKAFRKSRGALAAGLIIYVIDTAVFLMFSAVTTLGEIPLRDALWQALTLAVRVLGCVLLFRGWRSLPAARVPE